MAILRGEILGHLGTLLAQTRTGREPQRTPLIDAAVGAGIDLVVWTGLTFFIAGGLLYLASDEIESIRDRCLERPAVTFAIGVVAFGSVVAMTYFLIVGGVFPLLSALVFLLLLRGVGLLGFFTIGWALREDRATALGIGSLLAGIASAIPVVNNVVWFLLGAFWTGGVVLELDDSPYK